MLICQGSILLASESYMLISLKLTIDVSKFVLGHSCYTAVKHKMPEMHVAFCHKFISSKEKSNSFANFILLYLL